jgi:hypothetical protein
MLAAFSPLTPFALGSQLFFAGGSCSEEVWLIYPPPLPITLEYQDCYKPPGSAASIKTSGSDGGPREAYTTSEAEQTIFGEWIAGPTQYPEIGDDGFLIADTGDFCVSLDANINWDPYPPDSPIVIPYTTGCSFNKDSAAINVSY